MLLTEFLSLARSQPSWVAFALANGMPMKLLSGEDKFLEARLLKKIQGPVQLEICLEPNDAMLDHVPKGSVLLKAEVRPLHAMKPGWRCQFQVLDADDVLERRRAPRMQVHRMQLMGRLEGDSTWIFPVTVRDVGIEGLGIETREILEPGSILRLSGFQEFFPDSSDDLRFEVRATFGKYGMGLQLVSGQEEAVQLLRELHQQLGVVGRFWRALIGHARRQVGLESEGEMRVSIDFSVKQLRQRRAAQLALITDSELDALYTSLKEEEDLLRVQNELELLKETQKKLLSNRRSRKKGIEKFLTKIHPSTGAIRRG